MVAEVDENTDLYEEGHIPGAVKLHWRDDLQDPVERDIVEQGRVRAPHGLARDRQRHDRRPLRGQEQLVRRVRLLVPEDLRPRGRPDRRRRPPEVDRRGARADDRRARSRLGELHGAGGRRVDPRPPRRRARRASARKAARSSTSAARRSTAASWWRRPATSRRAPCARGTSRPRSRSRGRRPFATTARSSPPTSCASSTAARASRPTKEVLVYCRIGERSAHTWFVLRELLGYPDVKNYDGSWTEWGNLVDVPIETLIARRSCRSSRRARSRPAGRGRAG